MGIITPRNKAVTEYRGLHLYHFSQSNCSMRVRMTLEEKGLEWTSHHVHLHKGENVTPDMLPETLRAAVPHSGTEPRTQGTSERDSAPSSPDEARPDNDLGRLAELIRPIDEVERDAIERAMELCGRDVRKAAVFLGLSPATVYRKLKHWARPTSE